jgi:hypothetical protein
MRTQHDAGGVSLVVDGEGDAVGGANQTIFPYMCAVFLIL